mgnify:FL=1|tara:strand:- start:1821 stop:2027 length:207 start_codon:yes stop_codon:yes gene_type:complete
MLQVDEQPPHKTEVELISTKDEVVQTTRIESTSLEVQRIYPPLTFLVKFNTDGLEGYDLVFNKRGEEI